MTVFVVIPPASNPALDNTVRQQFPNDSLRLESGAWLISAVSTSQDISATLGIADPQRGGAAIVFATAGYWGAGANECVGMVES